MGLRKIIEENKKAIEKSAKLTTKTRKKLPGSVFCGPGRSFPVHDCAHVRAAKVYLNRSRFSASTRQKIAACINRKAKALGCPGKIPAKSKGSLTFEDLTAEEQKIFECKTFQATRELIEQSIENEGMELEFSNDDDCGCC